MAGLNNNHKTIDAKWSLFPFRLTSFLLPVQWILGPTEVAKYLRSMKESCDLSGEAQRSYGARLRVWERERERIQSVDSFDASSLERILRLIRSLVILPSLSRARSSPWYLTYLEPSLIPCFFSVLFVFCLQKLICNSRLLSLRGLAVRKKRNCAGSGEICG